MENNFSRDDPASRVRVPTASEARKALRVLEGDGVRLAERVITPWWYHLALGMIVALFVSSQALPAAAGSAVIGLGVIALPVLTQLYSRRYGLSISRPAGPRSRRLLFATLAILVLAMTFGVAIKLAGLPQWWVIVSAVFALVSTVVLGRRYDHTLRSEIADNVCGTA